MAQLDPVVRYLILRDDVEVDPDHLHRVHLKGLLNAIRLKEFETYPLLYREICVFLQLTACRASDAFGHIEIQHADAERVIGRTSSRPMPSGSNPLDLFSVLFRVQDIVFPEAGLYWVQFWYDERMLAQQSLILR